MKKILILSCSTGEGHNSAALAIEAAAVKKGLDCERVDPVSFRSMRTQKAVSSLYNNLIKKTPSAFGVVYKLGDMYSSTNLPSPIYWANASYADTLKLYIQECGFDAVICTHLYGMEAMTAIRKDENFKIPCYGVMTDYVCIPFLEETDLTGFFVPQADIGKKLAEKKVPEEKIFASGIPVHESFAHHPDKATSRKLLGMDPDKKTYLIMTGGIGCENMIGLTDALLAKLKSDEVAYILVGKNERLRQKLQEKYGNDARLVTVSFTKKVALYMAAADVMLSKPGGLSSTEAAVAGVPLIHVHAIPGCETYNADFFATHGMSVNAKNNEQAVDAAILVANDDQRCEQMRDNQRKYINPEAAKTIVEKVMEDEH